MRIIGTRSLSQNVSDWLMNTRQPRILHVFRQSCNLINEHRDVLCVVTPQIGNGPFNFVVEDNFLFFEQIDIESRVANSPHQLTIGNITFDTANANFWNARPDWGLLHSRRVDILRQFIELAIAHAGESKSPVTSLSTALARNDVSSSTRQASRLAGLGIGLTPSGDDYIIGALYAIWIIHPHAVAERIAKAVANTAAPLTTSLSAAWLRSAGKGEAGILWHDFFDALIFSNPEQVQPTMDGIGAVGATSGTDALAGFINTFIAYAETEKNHVIPKFL